MADKKELEEEVVDADAVDMPDEPGTPPEVTEQVTPKIPSELVAVENDHVYNQYDLQVLVQTAGNLVTTKEQQEIVFTKVKEEEVHILPTGAVYLPWTWYADKLSSAFPMSWVMVPQGLPQYIEAQGLVIWGFSLIISGVFCGFTVGQASFSSKNKNMNYADAMEGAKSNALMRLCKGIGMAHELWDKEFGEAWKAKYADYVDNPQTWSRTKKVWIKRKEARQPKVVDAVTAAKSEWVAAAIKKGIMQDKKDAAGVEELKITLLETYTDITPENASKYLKIGLKKIEEYVKPS